MLDWDGAVSTTARIESLRLSPLGAARRVSRAPPAFVKGAREPKIVGIG